MKTKKMAESNNNTINKINEIYRIANLEIEQVKNANMVDKDKQITKIHYRVNDEIAKLMEKSNTTEKKINDKLFDDYEKAYNLEKKFFIDSLQELKASSSEQRANHLYFSLLKKFFESDLIREKSIHELFVNVGKLINIK